MTLLLSSPAELSAATTAATALPDLPGRSGTVSYDRHGFIIDGRRRILLMGTVSYFRIARPDWRDRLQQLRDCGFNTVDVYIPWNFHEPVEGQFDFASDERNLAAYLEICADLDLFVCLRPGPYICNEWDGGGLPAWLFTRSHIRLRQNEPEYLRFVRRYLSHIHKIVRPFQRTVDGGPVIFYQLENELDFFPCEDPAGYIAALRDYARADGIDVPLIACIGQRTHVQAATGFVEGVLPTPNIYCGKAVILREAALARDVIWNASYRDGTSMAETPPFVTEMGREEISLRRVLASGFKGLGPFNFCGGTNWGRWHAVNNWNGLTFLSTSIDFGGMVTFDGRPGPAYAGARRLAGFVNAFGEEIALSHSVTSAETCAAHCDNPLLGVPEAEGQPNHIYSLVAPKNERGDQPMFVFLSNTTSEPQRTQVTVAGITFPCHSQLVIAPGYDQIAVANIDLQRYGLDATLRYCTAEIAACMRHDGITGTAASLVLYGDPGTAGELRLETDAAISLLGPETAGVHVDPQGMTLVFGFDRPFETTLLVGTHQRLHLRIVDKAEAGGSPLTSAVPIPNRSIALLETPYQERPVPTSELSATWRSGPCEAIEALGVLHGAGWYEIEFPASAVTPQPHVLHLPHASDIVSVYTDEGFVGAYLGDGGPLDIPLPGTNQTANAFRVRMRTEIWGHSNFHDTRWPSAHLGSLRGIQGLPQLNSEISAQRWRFAPEATPKPEQEDYAPAEAEAEAVAVAGGEVRDIRFLGLPARGNRGALLTLAGTNCLGEIRVGKRFVGRFLFGPELPVKLTGGPSDRFFLSSSWLADSADIQLIVRGIGRNECRLTSATLELLG